MANQRHLRNAPAREALIDIQFDTPISAEEIEQFASKIKSEFSQQTDLWEAVIGLNVEGTGTQANSTHSMIGKRFDSNKAPHVLQCRNNGFTFSRLSPYGNWDELRNEAKRLWEVFHSVTRLGSVTRIAVRYINEINLPLPVTNFSDYLVCPPKVPEALPQALGGFLQRLVIPNEENNTISVITQALEGYQTIQSEMSTATVILDIDVFRVVSISCSSFDEIWSALDILRDQKNMVFFEYLTEKTLEMYE